MAGEITFTGLSSNIDLNTIIDALVAARRSSHITPLENWKTDWETKLESISTLDSALASFYTTVRGMDRINELLVRTASSSNETVLTASANSDAIPGSHTVIVNQLAKSEKEVHTAGQLAADTIVNSSGTTKTFKYRYTAVGAIITVDVPNGTTLTGLKNLINNDPNNPGVTASIINTGTGVAPYHLVLTGDDTGAGNTIVVDPGTTATLTGYAIGTFTESQTASNSQIRVDGYPPAWIERTSNYITDVMDGITLNLLSTGTVTVSIATDTSATIEKIEAFKDAFNNVRTAIRDATLYNAETGKAGSLLGNYAVRIIQSQLNNLIAGTAPGFQDPDDTYVNLQQLGFSTDVTQGSETEGLLLLDTTILTEALNSNPDAVVDVFSAYFEGLSDDSQIAYQSSLPSITSAGIYDVEVNTATIQGRFKLSTEATWHPWIALDGSSGDYTLTGAAGYAEKGLALHITYASGTGTHSAVVRLKNGVVTQMGLDLEDLLSTSGPLNTLDGSYNDIVTNIEKRIDQEEDRLVHYEALLRQRFVRLDSYMNQMTQLGNYLTQYVANLSK